jgi:hypothetical protein
MTDSVNREAGARCMKCFNVVKAVLDETYDEIGGKPAERDAKIQEALRKMSEKYNNLLKSGGPDFSDPVTRFAYVFAYVPAHAHWLYELLTWSEEAKALFKSERLRVTCLGGGPGSDVVGLLKYLAESGVEPKLFCEIVDGCVEWKQTWADLAFTLDAAPSTFHTDYVIHDVADRDTWNAPNKFAKADLFTINFFASEITHLGDVAKDYLFYVFERAKSGAIFLMNDNADSRFYEWFDQVAEKAGLEVLVTDMGTRKIYDGSERKAVIGQYSDRFERTAKMQGKMAWRVLRKK